MTRGAIDRVQVLVIPVHAGIHAPRRSGGTSGDQMRGRRNDSPFHTREGAGG